MSIFTTLRDKILGTTPQRIVQRSLDKIDATIEQEYERVRKQLQPLAVPGIDAAPGNAAFEAKRCIEGMALHRYSALDSVRGGFEASAKGSGSNAGGIEFEARCRIREVRW